MGARGPVGKRPDMRHRHESRARSTYDEVEPGPVTWSDPDPSWHEIAADWYSSLEQSAQSAEYQASDVMTARVLAEYISRYLVSDGPMPGIAMSAFLSGCSDLLASAGSRRRVRMELARPDTSAEHHLAAVSSIAARRPSDGA